MRHNITCILLSVVIINGMPFSPRDRQFCLTMSYQECFALSDTDVRTANKAEPAGCSQGRKSRADCTRA